MAKYTVTHACGHQVEAQLFGKHVDRERRMTAMRAEDCPACRAAGSDLVGSVKQVAWAQDIRAALTPRIIAAHDGVAARIGAGAAPTGVPEIEERRAAVLTALAAERDRMLGRRAARDWIDDQHNDGYAAFMAIVRAAVSRAG